MRCEIIAFHKRKQITTAVSTPSAVVLYRFLYSTRAWYLYLRGIRRTTTRLMSWKHFVEFAKRSRSYHSGIRKRAPLSPAVNRVMTIGARASWYKGATGPILISSAVPAEGAAVGVSFADRSAEPVRKGSACALSVQQYCSCRRGLHTSSLRAACFLFVWRNMSRVQ